MTNEELIVSFEREFFTGWYSESAIKADLENRKAMDSLSTMGSSGMQTNRLGEKRNIYFQDFKNVLYHIDRISKEDSAFISRCERCKNQVNKLYDFVRNFQ